MDSMIFTDEFYYEWCYQMMRFEWNVWMYVKGALSHHVLERMYGMSKKCIMLLPPASCKVLCFGSKTRAEDYMAARSS